MESPIARFHGDRAFRDGDPARPAVTEGQSPRREGEYDYWDYVDHVVERAAAHGLMLGLLPLFVGSRGDGYQYLKPGNAYEYGLFLGRRYREQSHLFWILGGDNTPDTEEKRQVWERVARGIAVGEFLAHYHIDWLKEQIVRGGGWTTQDRGFWHALGTDQFVHGLTYLLIVGVLIAYAAG